MVAVVSQARTVVAVVQTHDVRVIDGFLSRTPEVRATAPVVVIPNAVVPVAGRKRREPEGILDGDAAVLFRNGTVNGHNQGFPFALTGQMPALGACTTNISRA